MKHKKIVISIVFALLLVAAVFFCCKNKEDTTVPTLTYTVQRGTLSIDVTASGNLALSQTADLAFDVSGYVYRVLVEEGDPVTEGQLVAEVDTFDWEKQKRALERAVVQAKASLNNAVITLEKTQNPTTTTSTISGAISAPDPLDVEAKELQVQQAEMSLEDAEMELERYLETSAQIVAPFDGFVTKVNVKGGDEIFKGAIAVSIADPTKFEADILVNEMDISSIEIGMPATVQVVASPTSSFPAKVTSIAPTATNQSGVINYSVKVELLSAEEIEELRASEAQRGQPSQVRQLPTQTPSGQTVPPQSLPGQLPSDQLPLQTPSGQTSPPQSLPEQLPSGQSSKQTTTNLSQSAADAPLTLEELRDGLSVTIKIIIEEKKNVLMVRSKAITQGTQPSVQVLKGDVTEQRVIKTGISNTQYIEVTEGLSEGEVVVIPQTTTTTTQQSSEGRGGLGIPGMGGGPPR